MKQYKVYLFDFDGTLFDTLKSSEFVFNKAFESLGVSLNQKDILFYTRVPIPDTYRKIVPNYKEEDIGPFLDYITELVCSNDSNKLIDIYDDTYDTILDLVSSEASLGIVTSNNTKHVKDILNKFSLGEFFESIVGNDVEKEPKPSPKGILKAISLLKETYSLDEIVYIGDAENDMIAAKAAGIDSYLLDRDNEYGNSEYNVIHSLSELL